MIVKRKLLAGLCAALALGLGACGTTPERKTLSPEDAAALKEVWAGKRWEGSWGGSCTGNVEVLDIEDNIARVRYEWGICGNSAGGYAIDDNAVLSAREMKVSLSFGAKADYVLQPDGSLVGKYSNRQGGEGNGRFLPVEP